jgi:hypothetical protein
MGMIGIIISGSRVVWLMAGGLSLWLFWQKVGMRWNKRMVGYVVVAVGMVMVVMGMVGVNYRLGDFVGGWDSDSVWKRMVLNWSAMKMWKENFFLGIGLGNFTSKLPTIQQGAPFYWWQPVHNVFLLWATEVGILGTIGATWVVSWWWRRRWWKEWRWLLVALVVTGMVDHYWITLPQNSWLLAVILGIL